MSPIIRSRRGDAGAPVARIHDALRAAKARLRDGLESIREHHGGILVAGACVISAAAVAISGAGAFLCDRAVRLRRRPLNRRQQRAAQSLAEASGAMLLTAEIQAGDGVALRGWYFRAKRDGRRAVLVLHGQADNRSAALPYAKMFLRHGYNVLCPDMRAHGESGGECSSYGPREAQDVRRWVEWLKSEQAQEAVFALGESMGAAILLQALPLNPALDAIVAESPFSSFREVSYDRVGQSLGTGAWAGRTLLRPVIESGFAYGRVRYGIDLGDAAPEEALAETDIPVLLVHGDRDGVVPVRHAARLLERRHGKVELWEVPGAGHCRVLFRRPDEFERRICGWFKAAAPAF